MTKIYKYQFEGDKLTLPYGAEIIHVDVQNDKPTIWAEVDGDSDPNGGETFQLVATGGEVPEGDHMKTFLLLGGAFVVHLYNLR